MEALCLFDSHITKSLRLDEFETTQNQTCIRTVNYLKDTCVRLCLRRMCSLPYVCASALQQSVNHTHHLWALPMEKQGENYKLLVERLLTLLVIGLLMLVTSGTAAGSGDYLR